jgi:drug/metabolite transporter (DMT)-like permease
MTAQALPFVILLGLLFGSTLIASRFAVGQFAPTTYIGLRLTIASLCHVVIYALASQRRWPSDKRVWRHSPVLGIFATAIPMTAIVTSLQFQSSGITAVLITVSPAITVLMAHFLLSDEPLTRRKSLGVVLALAGALLLTVQGETGLADGGRANPLGYFLVLLAMVSASASTIYARKYMRDLDSFDVASARMWVAALLVFPLSLLLVGLDLNQVTAEGYASLIYAALVGTFAGMMLAFYNIQRFGATASAVTAYVIPIVATIGGVLILDERITGVMLVGMALIVGGIALINQKARISRRESSTPLS